MMDKIGLAFEATRILEDFQRRTGFERINREMCTIAKAVNISNELRHQFAFKHLDYGVDSLNSVAVEAMRISEEFRHQNAFKHLDYNMSSVSIAAAEANRFVTVSEKLFAATNLSAMSKTFAPLGEIAFQTQRRFANLMQSFGTLASSVEMLPGRIELPEFIIPESSREVSMAGYLAKIVCDEDVEAEEEDSLVTLAEQQPSKCLELLRNVNPAFEEPYLGARHVLESGSPDRERQFYVSLRELWGHLLRELAPDDKVLAWLPEDKEQYLHKGKPTRKTRILYICRGFNHEPLSEFVEADTKELIKTIYQFDRLHELEAKSTKRQLRVMMIRTECWLMYVLRISKEV